jgi:hypothetical protein
MKIANNANNGSPFALIFSAGDEIDNRGGVETIILTLPLLDVPAMVFQTAFRGFRSRIVIS